MIRTYPITRLPASEHHPELWIQGKPERIPELICELPDRGLGVVGTRNASPRARVQIYEVISSLARAKAGPQAILSGFAEGVDRMAHEAALDAGIPTCAILGAGIDIDYPRGRDRLRAEICEEGGLLISPFPPGSEPRKHQFLERNRVLARLCAGLWVVEAPLPSGALNTARWMHELERPCFATPADPWDHRTAGNTLLLEDPRTIPLTGAHSLGAVWLELSQIPAPFETGRRSPTPLARVLHFQQKRDARWGMDDLRAWALAHGWTHREFDLELRRGLQEIKPSHASR